MGPSIFHSRGRTHAMTAAVLSSLVPGLGQLYNRAWRKGTIMAALAVILGAVVKHALGSLTALTMSHAGGPVVLASGQADAAQLLLAALVDPAIQAEIRQVLLPALLGLCVLATWSMIDAYRHGRG